MIHNQYCVYSIIGSPLTQLISRTRWTKNFPRVPHLIILVSAPVVSGVVLLICTALGDWGYQAPGVYITPRTYCIKNLWPHHTSQMLVGCWSTLIRRATCIVVYTSILCYTGNQHSMGEGVVDPMSLYRGTTSVVIRAGFSGLFWFHWVETTKHSALDFYLIGIKLPCIEQHAYYYLARKI